MSQNVKNAVARRAEKVGKDVAATGDSLAELMKKQVPEIARALPKHMDADRMARIALTLLRKDEDLAMCSQASFFGALMTCSQLGVEPGPALGEAYLIPFKRECTFVLGYRGMAKLFWQSPIAKSLDAKVVYANDVFDYEFGLNQKLIHKPTLGADRGAPIAYYACASTTNGGSAMEVLSPADVEHYRLRSNSPNSRAWRLDYDAMARKTCVRRLFTLLPVSTQISRAIANDDTVRVDAEPDAIDTPTYIDGEVVDEAENDAEIDKLIALIHDNKPDDWDQDRIEREFAEGTNGLAYASASAEQLGGFLEYVKQQRADT